jgi:hypothetical protein
MRFRLVIWFIEHLQILSTSNYTAIANLHTLQFLTSLSIIVFLFFLFIYGAGMEPSPLFLRLFIGLLYQPWMIDGGGRGAVSGINEWQGKPKYTKENLLA